MEKEYLEGREHDAYMDDISGIMGELIDRVLAAADKHNVDRDNSMQHFSQLLSAMVEISTFQQYGRNNNAKDSV